MNITDLAEFHENGCMDWKFSDDYAAEAILGKIGKILLKEYIAKDGNSMQGDIVALLEVDLVGIEEKQYSYVLVMYGSCSQCDILKSRVTSEILQYCNEVEMTAFNHTMSAQDLVSWIENRDWEGLTAVDELSLDELLVFNKKIVKFLKSKIRKQK